MRFVHLCECHCHWDTRPVADRDPDPANHGRPIPGANDGASGVATLMELARLFRNAPPPVGVVFVCFDIEDAGRYPHPQEWAVGAQQATRNWPEDMPIERGINLDRGLHLTGLKRKKSQFLMYLRGVSPP